MDEHILLKLDYSVFKRVFHFLSWEDRISLSCVSTDLRHFILGTASLHTLLRVPEPASSPDDWDWVPVGSQEPYAIFQHKTLKSFKVYLCANLRENGLHNCVLTCPLRDEPSVCLTITSHGHDLCPSRTQALVVKDGRGLNCSDIYPFPIQHVELVKTSRKQWRDTVFFFTKDCPLKLIEKDAYKEDDQASSSKRIKLDVNLAGYNLEKELTFYALLIHFRSPVAENKRSYCLRQYIMLLELDPRDPDKKSLCPVISSVKPAILPHDYIQWRQVPHMQRIISYLSIGSCHIGDMYFDEMGLRVHPKMPDAAEWQGFVEPYDDEPIPTLKNWPPKIMTYWHAKRLGSVLNVINILYDRLMFTHVVGGGTAPVVGVLRILLLDPKSNDWIDGLCFAIDGYVRSVLTRDISLKELEAASWLKLYNSFHYLTQPVWHAHTCDQTVHLSRCQLWLSFRWEQWNEKLSDQEFFTEHILPRCTGVITVLRKKPPVMVCLPEHQDDTGLFDCGNSVHLTWKQVRALEADQKIRVTGVAAGFGAAAADHCLAVLFGTLNMTMENGDLILTGRTAQDGWSCQSEIFVQGADPKGLTAFDSLFDQMVKTGFFPDPDQ